MRSALLLGHLPIRTTRIMRRQLHGVDRDGPHGNFNSTTSNRESRGFSLVLADRKSQTSRRYI